MKKYTEDEIKDIEARELEALEVLKKLQLTPSATMQAVNIGNDVFSMKVIPHLADLKFAEKAEEAKVKEKQ